MQRLLSIALSCLFAITLSAQEENCYEAEWMGNFPLQLETILEGDYMSFGYDVEINSIGNRIVASAPEAGHYSICNDDDGDGVWSYSYSNYGSYYNQNSGTDAGAGGPVTISDSGFEYAWGSPNPTQDENFVTIAGWDGGIIYGDESETYFGNSISLSGDGNTVAICGLNSLTPAYVYINSNEPELIGEPISGHWNVVSLNENGNILALGSKNQNMARIFSYNGQWSQIGQDIYGEFENDDFGFDLELNSTGNRIIIGSPSNCDVGCENSSNNAGSARVFELTNNNSWVQIGQDIDGNWSFGKSVTINGAGNLIAIGGPGFTNMQSINSEVGLYYYHSTLDEWLPIGEKIEKKIIQDLDNLYH